MNQSKHRLHDGRHGAALAIRLITKAKKNQVVSVKEDGTVHIQLTAKTTGKQANAALIDYLAQVLAVSPEKIEVVGGVLSNDKLVAVTDIEPAQAQERLLQHVGLE
jgi:uncharacterized protein YggU (UPF0235/DUF167 family)